MINEIIDKLREKNISEEKITEVKKAYFLAEGIHKNQYRQSGEPYITHPLKVAKILLDMEVYDPDAISAALLHDTIEDAKEDFHKEDIERIINPTVAELVDGVTKMRRMHFNTKQDQNFANTRKIVNGLSKDVRIVLIKLADRLHNMQTLEYKSPEKQKEIAKETMDLYVPFALFVGTYKMKNTLEDLSLQYLNPDAYMRIKEEKEKIGLREKDCLKIISSKLHEELNSRDINNKIILRSQTINTIYNKIKKGYELENIFDLFYLKVLEEEVEQCYSTIYVVHSMYPPINGRFKDYISKPKSNLYRSLHTTVSRGDSKLLKVKIRTFDMDKVAAFGIPAQWYIENKKTREETQEELRNKPFVRKIMELDDSYADNADFIKEMRNEILTEHVYTYNQKGEIVELPYGATALDFACEVFPDLLDKMTGVLVNDIEVPLDYRLKNNDTVVIKTKGKINHNNWENFAHTSIAKQKIKLLNGQI